MREVVSDVRSNADFDDRRLFVLVLDDALVADLRAANTIKEVARRIVQELGPSDLAAVVFTLRSHGSQEFTSDKARLLAAIDRLSLGFAGMSGIQRDVLYERYSASTLTKVAEAVAAIPDRRKSLIYLSVGIALDFKTFATPVIMGQWGDPQGRAGALFGEMVRTFQRTELANVSIYAVDAHGLSVGRGGGDDHRLNREFLQTLSANTGGFAVVNTNDFAPGVRQIFRENSSYYLIGYERAAAAADGRFHRIDVRVNRPDVTVRARRGYFAPREDAAAAPEPSAAPPTLDNALADILPKADVPLRITVAPLAAAEERKVALVIAASVTPPATDGEEGVIESIDVLVGAYDPRGESAGERRLEVPVSVLPELDAATPIEIPVRLDVEPGRYQLRLAVQLSPSGLTGSVFTDVDVPDFRKDAVSLSGVVLGDPADPGAEPNDAELGALVPVRPTVRRTFARDERVTAFVRVYQGGTRSPVPVALAVRIVDATDTAVLGATETLAPDRFDASRAAEHRVALPLSRLPAGPYLLTLEASLGSRSVRRDVRFTVQ